jgi:hypothetical protein
MKNISVPICPSCGSTRVKSTYLTSLTEEAVPKAKQMERRPFPKMRIIRGGLPGNLATYICQDCDYSGICPEVPASEVEGIRKQLEKKK